MTSDEESVRSAWDRNAANWADRVRAGRDLYREVFNEPAFSAFLPPLQGRAVVDLGCGEGASSRLLARAGARVTGIDLSPGMIAQAEAEETRAPLGISYRIGSFTRLDDIAPGSFEAAVSMMALMDAPDLADAVREVFRILKPGAPFCFSILHPCFVTPGFRWLKDEKGREQGLVAADYFAEAAYVDRFRFSRDPDGEAFEPFAVPRFPRRLETYVNTLIEVGFEITRLQEPRPTEAVAADHPWLKRWREHAAIFLYVGAKKPGR